MTAERVQNSLYRLELPAWYSHSPVRIQSLSDQIYNLQTFIVQRYLYTCCLSVVTDCLQVSLNPSQPEVAEREQGNLGQLEEKGSSVGEERHPRQWEED